MADWDAEIDAIRRALDEGRAPRAARTLQEAARQYQADSRAPDACDAFRLLARLELRRGNDDKALKAARSAERLARRKNLTIDVDRANELLSRIYTQLGEHARAQAQAREWLESARGRQDGTGTAEALRRLALAAWAGGDRGQALTRVAEAAAAARENGAAELTAQSERTFALMLLRAGCPAAAHRLLTELLPEKRDSAAIPVLVVRGWASMCLGEPGAAARDFREVRALARKAESRVLEIEGTASLAVVDLARAGSAGRAPRAEKSRAALDRALAQSRRFKDPDFEQKIRRLHESSDGRSAPAAGVPHTPAEAVHALLQLAESTDNLQVVDACMLEGRRLRRLPPDQPPYSCDPALIPEPS